MSKTIIIHATVPEDFNPTDMRIYDGEQSIYISPIEIIPEPTDDEIYLKAAELSMDNNSRVHPFVKNKIVEFADWLRNKIWREQ